MFTFYANISQNYTKVFIVMKLMKLLAITLLPLSLYAAPLHVAAEKGDWKEIKQLVAKGENINEKNVKYKQTPLQIAAYNENSNVVRCLLRWVQM